MNEFQFADFESVLIEDIKINPLFEGFFPKQIETERETLKESIKEFGIRTPIKVWSKPSSALEGDLVLIDGHNRLAVARESGITMVPIQKMEFDNEDDVIYFILQEQLGRRQLTKEQIEKYIAMRYMDILINKKRGNQYTKSADRQNDGEQNLTASEKVAKEVGKSSRAVERTVSKWISPFKNLKEYGYPITDEIENDILFDRIKASLDDLKKLVTLAKYRPKETLDIFNKMVETKSLVIPTELQEYKSNGINPDTNTIKVIDISDDEIEERFKELVRPNWLNYDGEVVEKVPDGYDGIVIGTYGNEKNLISIISKFEIANKKSYPFQGFSIISDSDSFSNIIFVFSKENNFVGKVFKSGIEFKYTLNIISDDDLKIDFVKQYVEKQQQKEKGIIRLELVEEKKKIIVGEKFEEESKKRAEEEKEAKRIELEKYSEMSLLSFPDVQTIRNVKKSDIEAITKSIEVKTGKGKNSHNTFASFTLYNNKAEFLYDLKTNANNKAGALLVELELNDLYSGYINPDGLKLLKQLELLNKKDKGKK
jgi:hypothetical protein